MTMTPNDQVNAVFDQMFDLYHEAVATYEPDIAFAAVAYLAATVVHSLEHDDRLRQFGPNATALATGVWTDSFHKFLSAVREACDIARARGIN